MKKLQLLFFMLLTICAVQAQESSVWGNLVDSYNDQAVIGAVVELVPMDNPQAARLTTTGYDGAFSFNAIPFGRYIFKASYMGYHDLSDTVAIVAQRTVLPKFKIKESSTEIDAVVKEVQAMRTSQHGDTLSYSAAAFKVSNDADVEGLLKKMPGITVTDGEVSAQGETVQKIYIDGREFFGSDVTTAINSLPAEMVDTIEVYDKLSDDAELSGIDDGEGYKSINIVTKKEMRQGFFGKLYAGGGYQVEVEGDLAHGKYLSGGNINYFNGRSRLSVLGVFNNINQQNFSFDDLLGVSDDSGSTSQYMVRPQAGIAEVGALGVNYSGLFGKSDNIKIEGSYFYNGTITDNYATTDKWFEEPNDLDTLHTEKISTTPNYNHRVTSRFEWKINSKQRLTLRQNVSFQYNDAESTTVGSMYGESGYYITDSYSLADKGGYNSSTSLSYSIKLNDKGRNLSVNGGLALREQDNLTNSYSNGAKGYKTDAVEAADTAAIWAYYAENDPEQMLSRSYKSVINPTSIVTLSSSATFAEPIAKRTRLTVKYKYKNKSQQTEKLTYTTEEDYVIEEENIKLNSSNNYSTRYVTHEIGPGVTYSSGKNKLSTSFNYQLSELSGEATIKGAASSEPITFTASNFTYSVVGQAYINSSNSLRLNVGSKSSEPGVNKLTNAYSLTSSKYISKGNPNLVPSYTTSAKLNYVRSNIERGTTFMIMGGAENQQDYIGTHTIYSPDTFTIDGEEYSPLEYSMPVNIDEYWMFRFQVEYGFPITLLSSNFNIRAGANYSLTPSMYGGVRNEDDGSIEGGSINNTESTTYNATAVLGSNISENIDFTLSWNGTYSEVLNSAAEESEENTYLSQTASAVTKLVFARKYTFVGALTYKEYRGITNDYQESYTLCNIFVGRKIFRNRLGELNVGVNDLFNQNTSFTRTVGSGYTQNTYNSVIGRYFSMQIVYNLRYFKHNRAQM